MPDPFGSMNGFLGQFRGFMQNPIQYFMQRRMNVPQNAFQNPQATVQQLLNSGQLSQQQLNQLQNMARKIQSDPQFAQMFGK
jgi:vancomycin permeability regulator SanA